MECTAWSFYDQIFKTHPKNFAKTYLILKNPKNPKNLGWKIMKCMKMRDLDTYQVKKNLIKVEKSLRKRFRERRECLGGEQA